ncbi:MAG: trimethylamine methyltransferase, partial [Porticoccaceae bacterium]|nr:trimethylamine methyltransferase [Porticoccaceae bacterium]
MTERTGRRRAGREAGGREGRREARANATVKAMPFIERKIPYFEMLSTEALELIEHNADRLLAEIGIDFLDDPEVLELFKNAGAEVEGTRVRFAPGLCRSIIQASAPASYTQHARNPARSVTIGGKNT